jgi:hypothetical protein
MPNNATYDFIVNDDNEVMLLLYAGTTKPEDARLTLNAEEHSAELARNKNETVVLEEIPDSVFDNLLEADTLLVCELTDTEKEDDSEIVYAYEAEIDD